MLRGVAMLWMAAFHFAFDLNFLGWLTRRQDFYHDPLWTVQRTCIVGLFLFCAGLSMALALHAGQPWPKFWRRWAQIAGCALLVSIGSAFMFPKSWIFFGVLHGMAVMLILARLAAPLGRALWLLGAACIAAPLWLQGPFFDQPWLQWIGSGDAQADHRGLRAGAAVAGGDADRAGGGAVAAESPRGVVQRRGAVFHRVRWRCSGAGR